MVVLPARVLRKAKPGEKKLFFLFGRMILTTCLRLWVIRPHHLKYYVLAAGLYSGALCLLGVCP